MAAANHVDVALASTKGQERAERIRTRIRYLEQPNVRGWQTKAEASAHRWVLARLEHCERLFDEIAAAVETAKAKPRLTQAQAVAIIIAYENANRPIGIDGRPVLDGLDLEGLGIR